MKKAPQLILSSFLLFAFNAHAEEIVKGIASCHHGDFLIQEAVANAHDKCRKIHPNYQDVLQKSEWTSYNLSCYSGPENSQTRWDGKWIEAYFSCVWR